MNTMTTKSVHLCTTPMVQLAYRTLKAGLVIFLMFFSTSVGSQILDWVNHPSAPTAFSGGNAARAIARDVSGNI